MPHLYVCLWRASKSFESSWQKPSTRLWFQSGHCHLQVSIQSKVDAADAVAQQLSVDKQSAEQAVIDLLKQVKSITQRKIDMCEQRYHKKDRLSHTLGSTDVDGHAVYTSGQASHASAEELVKSNNTQLAACKRLVLAFAATRDARAQLQKCLVEEQEVLQELQDPLQQSVANTKQLIDATAERLQTSDPARERRHAEMLIRYLTTMKVLCPRRQFCLETVHCNVCLAVVHYTTMQASGAVSGMLSDDIARSA